MQEYEKQKFFECSISAFASKIDHSSIIRIVTCWINTTAEWIPKTCCCMSKKQLCVSKQGRPYSRASCMYSLKTGWIHSENILRWHQDYQDHILSFPLLDIISDELWFFILNYCTYLYQWAQYILGKKYSKWISQLLFAVGTQWKTYWNSLLCTAHLLLSQPRKTSNVHVNEAMIGSR